MGILVINKGSATNYGSAVSQYTGEKTGGEFKNWNLHGTNRSDFIKQSYGILTSRCATLYNESGMARAAVNKPLTYAIGKGLFFKSLPNYRFLNMSEKEARDWGRTFSELLHYEKIYANSYKKQKQLAKEASTTGDGVLFFLRDKDDDKPFDLIATNGDVIDWTKSDEEGYTLGIKHDKFNRRSGFWSTSSQSFVPFEDENGNQVAIQFLFSDRAVQLRGLSIYLSEIARSKNSDRMWDAILERMIQEAIQLGYFNASDTDVAKQAREMARALSNYNASGDATATELKITPTPGKVGGIYKLENAEGLQFTDLKTPSDNFGTANEWNLKFYSLATGIPPEVLIGEYSTSYTAHKGAFNDFLQIVDEKRHDYITMVENKVNLEYLKYFAMTGQISVIPEFWTDYKVRIAYLQGTYLGPVPGQINPLQEVMADIRAVENAFTLRSTIAAKHGHDFWNSIEPWAEEQEAYFSKSPDKRAEQLFRAEKASANGSSSSEGDDE